MRSGAENEEGSAMRRAGFVGWLVANCAFSLAKVTGSRVCGVAERSVDIEGDGMRSFEKGGCSRGWGAVHKRTSKTRGAFKGCRFSAVLMLIIFAGPCVRAMGQCTEEEFLARANQIADQSPWFRILWNKGKGHLRLTPTADMLDFNSGGQVLDGCLYLNLGKQGRTVDDFILTYAHEAGHLLQGAGETRAFYLQNFFASACGDTLNLSDEQRHFVADRMDQAQWCEEGVKIRNGSRCVESGQSIYGDNIRVGRHPTIPKWRGRALPPGRTGGCVIKDDGSILREYLDGTKRQVGRKLPDGEKFFV
jgi:hypothetical protein